MRRLVSFGAVLVFLASPAFAEPPLEFSIRSKALAASAALAPHLHRNAPFRLAHEPIPGLHAPDATPVMAPRGACEVHGRDLCYDVAERRLVYRPVRQYMPALDGLTAESVTLRHDRLVLKYSFR